MRDYEQLVKQVSQSIKSVKVLNEDGEILKVAVLIDGYEKGDHLFSKVRERIGEMLKERSAAYLIYRDVDILPPRFVPLSVRLKFSINEANVDDLYETEMECKKILNSFLDPISGGFGGKGWSVGILPTSSQILAYFQAKFSAALSTSVRATALFGGESHIISDRLKGTELMLAINGEHMVDITVLE
jgi:hypothetical protein